jgi:hypothetical protein
LRPSAKCATCLGQTTAVIAVGLSVDDEVLAGQGFGYVWHFIPHRLCPLEIWTPFHRTFGTCSEALRSAAATCLTVAASVKELVVWPQTATTGDVLGSFIQPVNSPPCGRGALLVCYPLGVTKVSRAIRAHNPARGHHGPRMLLFWARDPSSETREYYFPPSNACVSRRVTKDRARNHTSLRRVSPGRTEMWG